MQFITWEHLLLIKYIIRFNENIKYIQNIYIIKLNTFLMKAFHQAGQDEEKISSTSFTLVV